MVRQMQGMSPYSMLNPQASWDSSGTRLTLTAGSHMTGVIAIQSGNPSTVTAQINLLSGLAQAQRSRVERDMAALAAQHLGGTAAAVPAAATSGGATPTPSTPSTSSRRPFDWGAFGGAVTGLFGGFASGMESYYGNQAGAEAVAAAQEEAGKHGADAGTAAGKELYTGPIAPEDDTPWQTITELFTGEPEPAPAAAPGAPETTTPPAQAGFPTWGWVAIGVGGIAVLGLLIWAVSGGGDDDDRRDRRRDRDYDRDEDMRENYGFRYFL